MTEEVKMPEDSVVFEYSFEKDYYDYDSLDWYEEAVDAYLDANYERAKTAAMLADFRLELEEEMEEEEDADFEPEEDEPEVEEEEDSDEAADSGEPEDAAEAEEPSEDEEPSEAEETIEVEEIQVATGEELIKTVLKAAGSTQAKLAESTGVSRSAVTTNLNKGVNAIQLNDFAAYLDVLGYEIMVLPKDFEQTTAVYVLAPEKTLSE